MTTIWYCSGLLSKKSFTPLLVWNGNASWLVWSSYSLKATLFFICLKKVTIKITYIFQALIFLSASKTVIGSKFLVYWSKSNKFEQQNHENFRILTAILSSQPSRIDTEAYLLRRLQNKASYIVKKQKISFLPLV